MIDAELEQIIAPMHDEIADLKRTLQDMRNALFFLGGFWTTQSGKKTTLHDQIEAIRMGRPVPVPETRRVILKLKSTGVLAPPDIDVRPYFATVEDK